MITVLAGGVGAARMLAGLQLVHPAEEITAVVNVGDDCEMHGLHISPDLDTVTYTLARAIDPQRGWGLADESWQAMAQLRRLGGPAWFNLGDRDLGTHLHRTTRLGEGAPLSRVTTEITRALGVQVRVIPVTDDRLRTMVTIAPTPDEEAATGREIAFQEYFVRLGHAVPITAVRFDGAEQSRPATGVLDAIADAERLVIAPSNPIVSIDPVLAVPGVRTAVESRRRDTVAVSPIVAGAALKGPADRMLQELGYESSVVGIARHYAPLARTLVIDEADRELATSVEAAGMEAVVTGTVMADDSRAAALARTVLA